MSKSKSPGRQARSPGPDASQIKAVRRAIDAGHVEQARQRLAALRKTFPGFKPLLGLAWELEDRAGDAMRAAARAHDWQHAAPASHAALEAWAKSTLAAGLIGAHGRARRRLLALQGHVPSGPDHFITALEGAVDMDAVEAVDLSRMHLADDNMDAAVAVLRGVDDPTARNKLAVTLAERGDFAEALSVAQANWEAHPENLRALNILVRMRCRSAGLEPCLGLAAPLRHTQPLEPEDAIAQVDALQFLGDAKAARQAWDAASGAAYWADAKAQRRETFDALRSPTAEMTEGYHLWFAREWIKTVQAISRAAQANEPGVVRRWDAQMDACDAHTDYLLRATELGDEAVSFLAVSVLKRRAQQGDAAALAALRSVLKQPRGSNQARGELLRWLADHGLRDLDEPTEVWFDGQLAQTRSVETYLSSDPLPSPFTPQGTDLHKQVHKLISQRSLPEALALAQQLLHMHPDEPVALVNVATILEAMGQPLEEVIGYYRQAHALAPDHAFALCGLATCLTSQGELTQARAVLHRLHARPRWHYVEYSHYMQAQHGLAIASGQHESARDLKATMDDIHRHFSA